MTALFRRAVTLKVVPRSASSIPGALAAIESTMGFELSNLDCVFQVKKTLKPEPNTAEIKVFNLAERTRAVLETPERIGVLLEAGYAGRTCQVFFGEVRSAHSYREGSDIITELSTGDSEEALATARFNMAVAAGSSPLQVLNVLVAEMGVGAGNVAAAASMLAAKGVTFGPTVFHGNAAKNLTDICDAGGIEWSVQDGVLQFLERGKPLSEVAVLLGPGSGLLGSPTVDHKGIVTAQALIQPGLEPGRKVAFETSNLKPTQGFIVQEAQYTGDTAGNDWQVKLTGRRY